MMQDLMIKQLGCQPYAAMQQQMQLLTQQRGPEATDELWTLEHPAVFTQGQAGKSEHVLNPGNIPVVQSDRGGQVTYHGPGQLVVYTLFDLQRLGIGIRTLVRRLEAAVIDVLAQYEITATGDVAAPGVYVDGAKICSLGLRVKRHCSYHGLAFNLDMDLSPFTCINPCGFKDLSVTQLKDFIPQVDEAQVTEQLIIAICQQFAYNKIATSPCASLAMTKKGEIATPHSQ